ncbi:MAG TPA: hypothetical protein DCZ91_15575 [Lachnospiraceae bacterium]|nr:hypothetical protein [Lachnospiraceae bacterium]
MTSDDAMERIEGFHCVIFYMQNRCDFDANAACGLRDEQGRKKFSCPVIQRHLKHQRVYKNN